MAGKTEAVEQLKAEGNALFGAEKWKKALKTYSKAVELAEDLPDGGVLLATLLSNRSAVRVRLERWEEALNDAERVVSLRHDWPRGYARRAVALAGLNRLTEAKAALQEGLKIDPENTMLLELTEHLNDADKRKAPEDVACFDEALKQIRDAGVEGSVSVVVFSGFLGAGKTTLLNWILRQNAGKLKLAVLVNDMAAINVDAELVRNAEDHHIFSEVTEDLVELSNGCVCCTLRADLIKEATRLLCTKRFDALVIEATGISEPMPVAATFTAEDFHGATLREHFTIDNMVTLVDASEFINHLNEGASLQEEHVDAEQEGSQSVGELLAAQVEFADTLILNKCDLVEREKVDELRALLSRMNPSAHLVESVRCEVPLTEILGTHRFRLEFAEDFDGFSTELTTPHVSETVEYGISNIIFTSQKPFHPVRLHQLLFGADAEDEYHFADDSPLAKAYRSKGWFYLAHDLEKKAMWSGAGRAVQFELAPDGWQASVLPEHLWPLEKDDTWHPIFGDRLQQLVVIGPVGNLPLIQAALESALLTEAEIQDRDKWSAMDSEGLWAINESSDDETASDKEEIPSEL